ncbi:hypothetical protein O3P69_002057 [Scylla paramamosain]|uniref:Uncharacterized protein n=1 Tax=Scylla paramamosain TaxID=85552 RepID=A0AAW0V6R5_SCYPA
MVMNLLEARRQVRLAALLGAAQLRIAVKLRAQGESALVLRLIDDAVMEFSARLNGLIDSSASSANNADQKRSESPSGPKECRWRQVGGPQHCRNLVLGVEFVLGSKSDAGRHLHCLLGLSSRGKAWLSLVVLCRSSIAAAACARAWLVVVGVVVVVEACGGGVGCGSPGPPPTTPAGVAAAPPPDLTTSHCHLFTSASLQPVLPHMPCQRPQTRASPGQVRQVKARRQVLGDVTRAIGAPGLPRVLPLLQVVRQSSVTWRLQTLVWAWRAGIVGVS